MGRPLRRNLYHFEWEGERAVDRVQSVMTRLSRDKILKGIDAYYIAWRIARRYSGNPDATMSSFCNGNSNGPAGELLVRGHWVGEWINPRRRVREATEEAQKSWRLFSDPDRRYSARGYIKTTKTGKIRDIYLPALFAAVQFRPISLYGDERFGYWEYFKNGNPKDYHQHEYTEFYLCGGCGAVGPLRRICYRGGRDCCSLCMPCWNKRRAIYETHYKAEQTASLIRKLQEAISCQKSRQADNLENSCAR